MRAAEQPLPGQISHPASRWRGLVLVALIALTTAARVWVIQHCPEPDGDAKGHLGIATALLSHPFSVSLHWVWPPGYHYFLAALLALGVTPEGVRFLDCGLAALLPVLVWRYAERTIEPSASSLARLVPFLAAVLCTVMPVVNLLGTSAQQETLFTIIVLATAWSLDGGRFALAGVLLAVATMVRYEACGAVGLLAALSVASSLSARAPALVSRLPAPLARLCRVRMPPVVVVPSLVTLGAWLLAHRVSDGSWFGFLRELHRYTYEQRLSFHQDPWTDVLWFPVLQPYYLFGLTLLLFFAGVRRAWRAGFIVPLGIYLFLLASYASKNALGSGRYYESLTPFVCISAAHGASAIGERRRWVMPVVYAAALAHVAWLLVLTGKWTFHV